MTQNATHLQQEEQREQQPVGRGRGRHRQSERHEPCRVLDVES